MRLVRLGTRGGRARLARRSRGVLVAVSLGLLAAGCDVVGGSAGEAAGGEQITVAVVPGFANAPLQVAVEHGLFSQRHLDVTVQTYQNLQQAYDALTSGQADVISGDYAGLLYAQAAQGRPKLRLVADGYDAAPGVMEVLTLPRLGRHGPPGPAGQGGRHAAARTRPVLGRRPLQRRDPGHRSRAAE